MRKSYVLSVLLLLASFCQLYAEEVSKHMAFEYAKSFFVTNDPLLTRGVEPQLKLVYESAGTQTRGVSDPALYVFNRINYGGFVIISGDSVTYPVLGYSMTGSFVTENMPVNIEQWLLGISDEINYLRSSGVSQSEYFAQQWNTAASDFGDIVIQYNTAKWDQTHPYNLYCPTTNGVKSVTGCTNTAIAIVMKARKWPDSGVGTVPSYTYQYNGQSFTISERKLGHSYDWDKMPDILTPVSSAEEIHQVATLMKDCGMISKAEYTDGDTGSDSQNTIVGLKEHMKYSINAKLIFREDHSMNSWHKALKDELDENGPVFFGGGAEMSGGHAFVLDGYTSKDYYGVNWGWGGLCDGYYLLTALAPSEHGTGGNGDAYNMNQHAIVGLKQAVQNEEYRDPVSLRYRSSMISDENGDRRLTFGLVSDTRNIKSKSSFKIYSGSIWNASSTTVFEGSLQLMLLNESGAIKELIGEEIRNVHIAPYSNHSVTKEYIINSQIDETDYIVMAYKSNSDSEWNILEGNVGCNSKINLLPSTMATYSDHFVLSDDDGSGAGGVFLISQVSALNQPFNISMYGLISIYDLTADFTYILYDKEGKIKENLKLDDNLYKDTKLRLGSKYNFMSCNCMITVPVDNGDYIAPAYRRTSETQWQQICGMADVPTKIILESISCLTDPSFVYDRLSGLITVKTYPDVQYTLTDSSGKIVYKGITSETGILTIDTSSIPVGTYMLILSRGKDTYSLSLTL